MAKTFRKKAKNIHIVQTKYKLEKLKEEFQRSYFEKYHHITKGLTAYNQVKKSNSDLNELTLDATAGIALFVSMNTIYCDIKLHKYLFTDKKEANYILSKLYLINNTGTAILNKTIIDQKDLLTNKKIYNDEIACCMAQSLIIANTNTSNKSNTLSLPPPPKRISPPSDPPTINMTTNSSQNDVENNQISNNNTKNNHIKKTNITNGEQHDNNAQPNVESPTCNINRNVNTTIITPTSTLR